MKIGDRVRIKDTCNIHHLRNKMGTIKGFAYNIANVLVDGYNSSKDDRTCGIYKRNLIIANMVIDEDI